MGSPARSKSGLTGQIQVSENLFLSRTHDTHPSNLARLGQAVIHHPKRNQRKHASHQTSSGSQDRASSQEGRASHTSMGGPTRYLDDPEKRELQQKPHRWIEAQVKCLDPAGCMEEINSFRYFGRNTRSFALEIIAIADWGRKFMDAGLNYFIPAFPQYLFSSLCDSYQGGAQVPIKPSQLNLPGGDVCDRSRESWTWLVAVLQFWGYEASIANGIVYRGHVHPTSALAEYVLNTINPGLEPRCQITWDDVVIWMPWMSRRLHGMTSGKSSELELTLERRYSEHILNASLGRGKAAMGKPSTPVPNHSPHPLD